MNLIKIDNKYINLDNISLIESIPPGENSPARIALYSPHNTTVLVVSDPVSVEQLVKWLDWQSEHIDLTEQHQPQPYDSDDDDLPF